MSERIHFDLAVLRRPAPTDGQKLSKFILRSALREPSAMKHLGKRPVFFVLRARNLEMWVTPSRSVIDEMARAVAAQGKEPQAVALFSIGLDGQTRAAFADLQLERRGKRYQAVRPVIGDDTIRTWDHGEIAEERRWIGVQSTLPIEPIPFDTVEQ